MADKRKLAELISQLKAEKDAVILAHNYQREEIQEIADYVGDSLGLIREGARTSARIVVLCGIRFIAEAVTILSPEKIVLLPRKEAGCPMADTVTPEDVRKLRLEQPQADFVCFVNTDASVKAECDVCCTSSNALQVVNKLDGDEVVFIPDRNLASWVSKYTPKKILPWFSFCFVHERIDSQSIHKTRELHHDVSIIVHPGCRPDVVHLADKVLSTEEMVEFSKTSAAQKIAVGSEEGLVHRLHKESPQKTFYTVGTAKMCKNMKITTLEDAYLALKEEKHKMEIPEAVSVRAGRTLERMFDLCGEDC